MATQVDQIFFPDGEINLGGLARLPGIDKAGDATEIGGSRINILVMGLDRRPIEGSTLTRSDTMFVMTIDPTTKTSRGLAMPRDLWVDIPTKSGGTFKERINTVLVYGETMGYPGGGPGLAKATVERLLKIKIHYYVIIDFEGFKKVIDGLGGIDVDVPTAVNDPFYSETERLGDFYPCVFSVGVHHMNGSDALCYARTRRNSDDRDRITRQQRIMLAVLEKASQLHLLAEPQNMVSLWKSYKNTIKTDISDLQIPGFARLAAGMDPDDLAFLSLGPATVGYTTPDGAAVLLPSEAGIEQIVKALYSNAYLEQESAVVEIQNGTDRQGFAQTVVRFLSSNRGDLPEKALTATNAAQPTYTRTEIIDFTGKTYTAGWIASRLDLKKTSVRPATPADAALRTVPNADIVVILGTDAKVDVSAVAGN
ncbi:MAG TPA: LCP family protein [Dehalococcoidia bacterium]|nr:LCP family protein [Dehalococcoidia bacterium]